MATPAADLFRANLAAIMRERGITITALSQLIGTSRPRLSRILSGDEGVTIDFADRVASHFHVSLSDFLSENLRHLVSTH